MTSYLKARQRAIEARLEVEVQAFERHREWLRREAEAYHTTFRYLSLLGLLAQYRPFRSAFGGISKHHRLPRRGNC
ncbi:hypothetical protein N7524_010980 [Penicillium chrysogenum]|nr:hypothetical protein N7524_010980 [Penicillium chrysogenum]